MHGGVIAAESDGRNHGATFRVELLTTDEALQAAAPVEDPSTSAPESAATANEPPMRLLLVEDHEPTLAILARLLTRVGHTVSTASSVSAAREAASREQFDAVISDIGLPDGTGIELITLLHASYGLRGIALSGYGMEEDVRRSEDAGFLAHLVKPVEFSQLRQALARLAAS
jgi:CheY-like chemotaxis protein